MNRAIRAAQAAQPAPAGARVLYATQGATDPPTFTLFSNREVPRKLERGVFLRTFAVAKKGKSPSFKTKWTAKVAPKNHLLAVVLAEERLLIGVQLDRKDNAKGAVWIMDAASGNKLGQVALNGVPKWDGLAVTQGNVLVSTLDGRVICLGKK